MSTLTSAKQTSYRRHRQTCIDYLQSRLPHCRVSEGSADPRNICVNYRDDGAISLGVAFTYPNDSTPEDALDLVRRLLSERIVVRAAANFAAAITDGSEALNQDLEPEAKKLILLGLGGDS